MELGPVLFFILSHLRDVVFALALAGAALSFRLLLRGARPLPAASLAFLAVLAAVASPAASRPWALFSIPGALILAGSAAASAFSFSRPGFRSAFLWCGAVAWISGLTGLFLFRTPVPMILIEAAVLGCVIAWGTGEARAAAEARRSAQEALLEARSRQAVQEAAARATAEAVSRERSRYIQDMHDGLGGELVSTLSAVKNGDTDPARVISSLQSCLDQMRIAIDASGVGTEDFGTALANLRYRMAPRLKAAGIQLKWNILGLPDGLPMDPALSQCVLRVLQESLTNAIKYSHATEILMKAEAGSAEFRMTVEDNGVGLGEKTAAPSADGNGLGLRGMNRRVAEAGGTLSITGGGTGRGVRISLTLPLPPAVRGQA